MERRAGSRNWIWMAVPALVFAVLGVTDLLRSEHLSGTGFVICSAGSALLALGDRRESLPEGGRPWRVLGGVVSLVGIGLLSMATFG